MFLFIFFHILKDVHELLLVVFLVDNLNYIHHNFVVDGNIQVEYLVLDINAMDQFLIRSYNNMENMVKIYMDLVEVNMDLFVKDMDFVMNILHKLSKTKESTNFVQFEIKPSIL